MTAVNRGGPLLRGLAALAPAGIVLASVSAAFAAPHDTTLVSRASGGAKANGASTQGAVSGDGRYVAFMSDAANLSKDDPDSFYDIFVRDLATSGRSSCRAPPGPAA